MTSPLNLPEILTLIVSYLPEDVIRLSVAPVCRLWLQTVQNTLVREVVWYSKDSSDKRARAMLNLLGAEKLICHHQFTHGYDGLELLKILQQTVKNCQLTQQQPMNNLIDNHKTSNINEEPKQPKNTLQHSQCHPQQQRFIYYKHVPLQRLELFISELTNTTIDDFPFPPTLTTLQLTFTRGFKWNFSLARILLECPHLASFYAAIDPNPYITIGLKFSEKSDQYKRYSSLVLQSLVLSGFNIVLNDLDRLLTRTPNLKKLKLINVHGYPYDLQHIITYTPTLSTKLESTHISFCRQEIIPVEIKTRTPVIPNVSECSLENESTRPTLLQTLESASANVITKLVLNWGLSKLRRRQECHSNRSTIISECIHNFLCNSPHLMHLTIIKSAFLIGNMDLFRRRTFAGLGQLKANEEGRIVPLYHDPNIGTSSLSVGIWKCRNLKTLHFDISTHMDVVPFSDPVQSRILFGYISRVCPNLEDLHISWSSVCGDIRQRRYMPRLSLQLDGGLCLLARLQSLRRLKIEEFHLCQGDPNCHVYELNWFVPSGLDIWSCTRRQKIISQWQTMETQEYQLEEERKRAGGLHEVISSSDKQEDIEIAKNLQNLGLLCDVKNMVEEMDRRSKLGFAYFPRLEWLSFEFPYDLRPNAELQRLFPKTSKQIGNRLQWLD
ncbi:hypothetical protein FBU30_000486 [Linnemannia zychae]|nr:hypothetical protein FBU30_000486 [Linnemannia zychae]